MTLSKEHKKNKRKIFSKDLDGVQGLQLLPTVDHVFRRDHYPRPFEFNADVALAFDDMATRSIPLYREVLDITSKWACLNYQLGTRIIDIGCSTGTCLSLIGQMLQQEAELHGIDTSLPMLELARKKLDQSASRHQIFFSSDDALTFDFRNASIVIMNYTLQFIPVVQRKGLIQRIFDGLNPGGVLIVSDKLRSDCPEIQESWTFIYERFKRENGYSQTEIERKKEALDQVLVPLTSREEIRLLRQAGFSQVETILRWQQFATFVAVKSDQAL